jgi:hypothetical protein
MNRTTLKLLIGDFFILVAFALLPGIRGYSDWHYYEYLMIAFFAGYTIYRHHKKNRQTEPK